MDLGLTARSVGLAIVSPGICQFYYIWATQGNTVVSCTVDMIITCSLRRILCGLSQLNNISDGNKFGTLFFYFKLFGRRPC